MTFLKGVVRSLLQTGAVGRPTRKVLFSAINTGKWLYKSGEAAFVRHPYVKKLNNELAEQGRGEADQAMMRYYRLLEELVNNQPYMPKVSIIVPVYNVDEGFFLECLESIGAQVYKNWEVCIVDDASSSCDIRPIVDDFARRYPERVLFKRNEKNSHISATSNAALNMASGDYIGMLDHDDRLLPNALGEVVRYINLNNRPDILYSDESKIDTKGEVLENYHKPGWSPLMHLSVNYTTHFSVYRRDLVNQVGGFRQGFEGAQDHDLMLRLSEVTRKDIVHIPLLLYQWRVHPASTAHRSSAKSYTANAGEKAVTEACNRRGHPAKVEFEPDTLHYKVKFAVDEEQHRVSILIPTQNSFNLISSCLRSIFEKTRYQNFEVILIDHESDCEKCKRLFDEFEKQFPNNFRKITFSGHFNFARMNNLGAEVATGRYLLLLNNDTEVIEQNWLGEMVAVAQLERVGAVGAKLLYPDSTIQHAGLVGYGFHLAGHAALQRPDMSNDYYQYHQTTHEVLGVTGACLMVNRNLYFKLGGLEELYVPNGFGDLDLCLRIRKAGYNNVYVPYAKLFHKESPSRKKSFELFERQYILDRWASELSLDPYMNPCLERGPYFTPHIHYETQQVSGKFYKSLLGSMVR